MNKISMLAIALAMVVGAVVGLLIGRKNRKLNIAAGEEMKLKKRWGEVLLSDLGHGTDVTSNWEWHGAEISGRVPGDPLGVSRLTIKAKHRHQGIEVALVVYITASSLSVTPVHRGVVVAVLSRQPHGLWAPNLFYLPEAPLNVDESWVRCPERLRLDRTMPRSLSV